MEEQEKTIARIKTNEKGNPMIAFGGVSVSLFVVIGVIAWAVNVFGQVEGNSEALIKNAEDHKVIYASLEAIRLENNTIKTLQKERHTELTKRLDRQEAKLDAIMDKLSK